MVVGEASIHNIMGGMESTGGVRLHNHKRKLKQRFDIIKKLGQGTYGKVQLGINKETGQEVAIKTIKKCKIETEADLIRIRREIQIMSSVQHPNIIHIYEVFENREKMVLVMEYAAGGELYDYLSERKVLTEHEARRIFRQIATAVFYCHKHKICHRDLKLENILLDQVGNAKIADFGLSNVFDEQRLLNTFCGSPLYASPEIVKGTPYHGPEVDCWSLGVLLYTLVYGAMPFDGSNFKRLVKQISQSDYFEPKKPSPASPLIKDMLTVCPARRADIEKICTHWWVNEGYEQNCLDIAEDLAAQTPVRLDLLLSLVPQSASAEKLLVGDQQPAGSEVSNSMSSETLVPTRCHSVGSLMELDQAGSDRRIRDLLEEDEPRSTATGEAKRKLETTPSMDETAAAGVKRKERARRKEKPEERDPRAYKSASRHHSAPIPNPITEEAMEIDPAVSVPIGKTVDLNEVEAAAACLELIEECKERSPSKERSKTPVTVEQQPGQPAAKEPPLQSLQPVGGCVDQGKSFQEDSSRPISGKSANQNRSDEDVAKPGTANDRKEVETGDDTANLDASQREIKKLKEKALSLDTEMTNDSRDLPGKSFERRRSKIFETAEKFNQLATGAETDKPKKIFIPGVNVGGAKRVFERKASLSSITVPPPTTKPSASKVIIDVPAGGTEKRAEKPLEKTRQESLTEDKQKEDARKRAVDIITGAIGKPPVQRKMAGSPPTSPQANEPRKLPLKIPVAANDARTATVSVSTPVETKFPFERTNDQDMPAAAAAATARPGPTETAEVEEPKMSSKMEITLKSATLPRPRKTSKAEISLSGIKSPEPAFKSEVEAKIDAFHPQKLRTQRSEIAFPVAAAAIPPQTVRSSSLEPEGRPKSTAPKERIIPIQVEPGHSQHGSTPPPKPPMPQRSTSQRSGSLSRQSTADSDTDSALGSTLGPEPIRKSPREYIIPIAVEGGGYVTPRSGSVEPESKTSTPTSANPPRSSRFGRGRRMSSLLSDASEDESPFSSLHRDSEDLLQRHMHRLRSSRPSRQPPEHADSLSSGEDDDDDGFELLTAENLFSTLLSRVRSLTQRLNVDENRSSTGFPSSRLFGRLGSNTPQAFWGLNKPLSRRLTESQFKHSLSREGDLFSRKDSANSSSNPGTPNSNPSRENVFEIGSNTLPRDKVEHEGEDLEPDATQVRKEQQETLEQSFTPSLARRLSRQFIEQQQQQGPIRYQSLPRSSPSSGTVDRNYYYRSPSHESLDPVELHEFHGGCGIRRTSSLLEPGGYSHRRCSPRRSVSGGLFEDDDDDPRLVLSPFPRQIMTLGRKYKEAGGSPSSSSGILRRENFNPYRTTEKIQEETGDDSCTGTWRENGGDGWSNAENGTVSECTSASVCNSSTNLLETTTTTSSVSARSCDTSPTESTSNPIEHRGSSYRSAGTESGSMNFETRLLAAENLIKESKLRNLGPGARFDPNLSTSYGETEKCEKESLAAIREAGTTGLAKRRSCIPSLRLRSGSLTRESSLTAADRRKSFTGSQDALGRSYSPEKSLLGKLFRGTNGAREAETRDKAQKPRQHRISRFLRPDFFDTPREESQYVKEKEAKKAADNERRKSRFMRRKTEDCAQPAISNEEKREKDVKNEINSLKRGGSEERTIEKPRIERQGSKSSFLHTLEKKLERLRSNEEQGKPMANGGVERKPRENSAPPADSSDSTESGLVKKAISVENLSNKPAVTASRNSRVSSVLGLFKSADSKQATTSKPPSALLSKLKRSPPKVTKPDAEDPPSTSRIPTKFSKSEPKVTKKPVEPKKPAERSALETKRSPPKEKPKEKPTMNGKEKRVLPGEKTVKEIKRSETAEKTDSPPKEERKSLEAGQRSVDQAESASQPEEKKLLKTRRNSSLAKSGSSSEASKQQREEAERKAKKVAKTAKEGSEKEDGDAATKKKRIVRVVKKVVKKSSDSSEGKPEDKGKAAKTVVKKRVVGKSEKSPEPPGTSSVPKTRGKENEAESASKLPRASTAPNGDSNAGKPMNEAPVESKASTNDDSGLAQVKLERMAGPEVKLEGQVEPTEAKIIVGQSTSSEPGMIGGLGSSKLSEPVESVALSEESERPEAASGKSTDQQQQQRVNRSSLRLDLSKIPQHTFRNSTPRRESPKTDSPRPNTAESPKVGETVSEKLMECLSKMSNHGSVAGNKATVEKPLRARDVAELKREVTECARIIESHIEGQDLSSSITDELVSDPSEARPDELIRPGQQHRHQQQQQQQSSVPDEPVRKESPNDYSNELFSPMDEPESFDSWSVSSADFSHHRTDLQSPTSPSPSLFSRSDNSESVIDRIRRRSFYSRFNDRKRPSLTVPPPGITVPQTSCTLPRKYSLGGYRDRSKYSGYGTTARRDRGYSSSLYTEDTVGLPPRRSSSTVRERYTEAGADLKSPSEHYTLSSSYDPLRRYLRSPTFDLSTTRGRYHSADFATDSELGSCYRTGQEHPSTGSGSGGLTKRKYGETSAEPKSVEYYEELLAPSNPDYLSTRKSPLPGSDYLASRENGYHHNGNLDLHLGTVRRKSYAGRLATAELDDSDQDITEQKRKTNDRASETRNLASPTVAESSSGCPAE